MAGRFPEKEVEELLVKCHRRCCICHRFCGVKMEIDHIEQKADGGSDDIENAIPVCFECHAEIHSYNDKHSRGRKFHSGELRRHKEQWLKICEEKPEMLINAARRSDVGPLQALIDELEFNARVVEYWKPKGGKGCLFHDKQFKRAIQEGAIAILLDELKSSILEAYVAMGTANQAISAAWLHTVHSTPWNTGLQRAGCEVSNAKRKIEKAIKELLCFLSSNK